MSGVDAKWLIIGGLVVATGWLIHRQAQLEARRETPWWEYLLRGICRLIGGNPCPASRIVRGTPY